MYIVVRYRRGPVEDELFIDRGPDSDGSSMFEILQTLEGTEVVSVSTKETREELRSAWRVLVNSRSLECSFKEWLEAEHRRGHADPQ